MSQMDSLLSILSSPQQSDSIFADIAELFEPDDIEVVMQILENRSAAIREVPDSELCCSRAPYCEAIKALFS